MTRPIVPVEWRGDAIDILDQRALPFEERHLSCRTVDEVCDAIRTLAVRGAPLLGIVAAYAIALEAVSWNGDEGVADRLRLAGDALRATRPTAVNIAWAVDRMLKVAEAERSEAPERVRSLLVRQARSIEEEDARACEAIGAFGAELVPEEANVLTHCNTGMLCTGGIGTAQGVIYAAHQAGKRIHVWVDETRPVWQGARLTAWELGRLEIPRTLIADGAAASLMASGRVDLVITGADRIAADGSAANKIGTYGLAVLAHHHGIPFVIAAPTSTIDLDSETGADIAIEERDGAEVSAPAGRPVAEPGTPVANPAFDVTPPELISAIVTERGVVEKPYPSRLRTATEARGA